MDLYILNSLNLNKIKKESIMLVFPVPTLLIKRLLDLPHCINVYIFPCSFSFAISILYANNVSSSALYTSKKEPWHFLIFSKDNSIWIKLICKSLQTFHIYFLWLYLYYLTSVVNNMFYIQAKYWCYNVYKVESIKYFRDPTPMFIQTLCRCTY